jgi:hypothetical protein
MAGTRQARFPDGHFYSPIVDIDAADAERQRLWPDDPPLPAGIDFDPAGHERFLLGDFARYVRDYDYPDDDPGGDPLTFYNNNPQYGVLDSRSLFVMLRALRPKKMVEVGSGYSSLLTADVNRRYLGGSLDFTCVEPHPPGFLRRPVPGISRVVESRVQDLGATDFGLDRGDVLFIDSSHVAKLGSDVNYLYFEILPRLKPGVIVHIHDIFFPDDYSLEWVVDGRSWNEQYVVRALLMDSPSFRVLFAGRYAYRRHRASLSKALGGPVMDGCSLWLERTAASLRFDPASSLDGVRTRHLARVIARRAAVMVRNAWRSMTY